MIIRLSISPQRDEVENGGGRGEAQFDEVMTKNVPKVIKI